MFFDPFRSTLRSQAADDTLRDGVIGEGLRIPGLGGEVPLTYADYTASGRAMRQVEDSVAERVLPFYANSHTEASYCGSYITRMRAEARGQIARLVGATEGDAVIFAGAGATAGLNRLVSLWGVNEADRPVVFIGPYEHHSNILPWRESRAEVIEIAEAPGGGVDLDDLRARLEACADRDLKIGAFSAASNVTGVLTDPDPVSRLLRDHGALSVWDYAGGGPYLPIDMGGNGAVPKDAVVISPHKFPGGPGASGVLVVNRASVHRQVPSWPGGGTVSFVSPWAHSYSDDLVAREEAGTPNVIGDIRAALAFLVKEAMGEDAIATCEARFSDIAWAAWGDNPHLQVLGPRPAPRLPIFSFRVTGPDGRPVHQQLFTRMLSDIHGIQARGGCACAGPYAHRLLGIDRSGSEAMEADLRAGHELAKPGWVRLNLSYMMREATVHRIVQSVSELAAQAPRYAPLYEVDPATAQFRLRAAAAVA